MHYISSLSGGVASAVSTDRAIQRYGRKNVTLWFADTLWEDEDLYRFLDDCLKKWGGELSIYKDGRTPLQLADDKHIIPNNRVSPCSGELKFKPFAKYLKTVSKPVTILLGMDWTEIHRMETPKHNYEKISGVSVDFPLMWKPCIIKSYFDIVREWGIKIPQMYNYGFPHNNCGGRCIRQGAKYWRLLKGTFPDRFAEVRDWEQDRRSLGDSRANYAILKSTRNGETVPLPLTELDIVNEEIAVPIEEDLFSCFCSY